MINPDGEEAADRIEELEAKLATAVSFMEEAYNEMRDGCDSSAFLILQATIAELKGEEK